MTQIKKRNGSQAALQALWCNIRRRDVMPFSLTSFLRILLRRQEHLVHNGALRSLLQRSLDYHAIEDSQLPLHVVASERVTGDSCGGAPSARSVSRRL
ncbi:hypothetical protein [Variovorax sp. YR216]|uniref:hypothetical protein n=1 Tax=Variovorax sp. YR216 TaxID=1882828 RepID=UPI000898A840|nr:hypothetical protein [Variovorax sp. YR216]SEA67793.1 NTE family protein [Variovorax sp. YR216]